VLSSLRPVESEIMDPPLQSVMEMIHELPVGELIV